MKNWFYLSFFILFFFGCTSSETKTEEKQQSSFTEKKLLEKKFPEKNNQPIETEPFPQKENVENKDQQQKGTFKSASDTISIGKKYVMQIIKEVRDSSSFKNGVDSISINASLPYGAKILVTHNFPLQWESPYEEPTNPNTEKLQIVGKFYNSFVYNNKTIGKPKILKLEYLQLPYSWLQNPKEQILYTYNNCKLRLPNIGPYECYYYTVKRVAPYKEWQNVDFEERPSLIMEVGNLLLVNSKTRIAKVLNVYAEVSEPFSFNNRFFYIKEDGTILIYEFGGMESYYETGICYSVNVSSNGEISFVRNK